MENKQSNKKMSDFFPVGQRIFFHGGNFLGHYGTVQKAENESEDPRAIFGFLITVKLENGEIVFAEKTEHISKVKKATL